MQKAVNSALKKWQRACSKRKGLGFTQAEYYSFIGLIFPYSTLDIPIQHGEPSTLVPKQPISNLKSPPTEKTGTLKKEAPSISSHSLNTCILSNKALLLQIQQLLIMAEEKDPISNGSLTLSSSNSKSEVEVRREKKKKLAAFKTFLDNNKNDHAPLEDLPARRKMSETEMQEEKLQPSETCKICQEPQSQPKLCEFCKDTLCSSHMKKRRRNPDTNKWTRICENCEDRYLMEKHYQNQMKTEESLLTQEVVVRSKHTELREAIEGKRVKLQMLKNKGISLTDFAKKENTRLAALQNDLEKKTRKLESGLRQNSNLQFSLMSLQKSLPPSLEADYQCLQQENSRITTDLVRYQKLCIDAVKARSQREREMYQEYYEWQQQRREELQDTEKKEEECAIY